MNTEQRVAVVTGAGRGIGREYSLALARAGFAVAVADLSRAGLLETVGLIEKDRAAPPHSSRMSVTRPACSSWRPTSGPSSAPRMSW